MRYMRLLSLLDGLFGVPPSPPYIHRFVDVDGLAASYIQIYIYFGVIRLGISKSWQVLSGGSLDTTTGDFCPSSNYMQGVKEIGGKGGVLGA